ncbi:MAG: alpha-rhamnosidase, partial [Parafilimonas sp.]|nr:alpha-rhamnosidase [Parafilimonas sp.]
MRKLVFILMLIYFFHGVNAQSINPTVLNKLWNAPWIEMPGTKPNDYGVYHFRKNFMLIDVPKQFIVHVSADNRYKLYVNGEEVVFGPAKGDLYHWNFETIDIASHLTKGKNTIAALVWNFGEDKPVWQ